MPYAIVKTGKGKFSVVNKDGGDRKSKSKRKEREGKSSWK